MKTYKVTGQEFSVSWKEEDPIGKKFVGFEEYENERAMLLTLAVGEPTDENVPSSEKEQLEECLEHLKEELKSEGGLWSTEWGGIVEDYEYCGRPEPHDGYGASGTFYTYEEIKQEDVLKEKVNKLSKEKEKALRKISKLTDRVTEIETELESLMQR